MRHLNIIQILARSLFGVYGNSHLEKVFKQLNSERAAPQLLLDRVYNSYKKAYPEKKIVKPVVKVNSKDNLLWIDQLEKIKNLSDDQRAKLEAIQALLRKGTQLTKGGISRLQQINGSTALSVKELEAIGKELGIDFVLVAAKAAKKKMSDHLIALTEELKGNTEACKRISAILQRSLISDFSSDHISRLTSLDGQQPNLLLQQLNEIGKELGLDFAKIDIQDLLQEMNPLWEKFKGKQLLDEKVRAIRNKIAESAALTPAFIRQVRSLDAAQQPAFIQQLTEIGKELGVDFNRIELIALLQTFCWQCPASFAKGVYEICETIKQLPPEQLTADLRTRLKSLNVAQAELQLAIELNAIFQEVGIALVYNIDLHKKMDMIHHLRSIREKQAQENHKEVDRTLFAVQGIPSDHFSDELMMRLNALDQIEEEKIAEIYTILIKENRADIDPGMIDIFQNKIHLYQISLIIEKNLAGTSKEFLERWDAFKIKLLKKYGNCSVPLAPLLDNRLQVLKGRDFQAVDDGLTIIETSLGLT